MKEGQYQLSSGRVIWKPTKIYATVEEGIADLPKMSLDDVEFYADYFGWYSDNKMYGHAEKIGELTTRMAVAAREELTKRLSPWPLM